MASASFASAATRSGHSTTHAHQPPWRFVPRLDAASPGGLPGDVNHDGSIDGGDNQPFITLLITGGYDCPADLSHDGVVNSFDIPPFALLLLQ